MNHKKIFLFLIGVLVGGVGVLSLLYMNKNSTVENGLLQSARISKEAMENFSVFKEAFAGETTQQSITENTAAIDPWNSQTVYVGGEKAVYQGAVYRAKWWTQGEIPSNMEYGVWEYIGQASQQNTDKKETVAPLIPSQLNHVGNTKADCKVIAYYPSWKPGGIGKLQFDTITHVVYAFAIPTREGGLMELENPTLAKEIIEKAHQKGAKAMLAVGGWSYNDVPLEPVFMEATATEEKIVKFGDAIVNMCDQYGFDGIDMDWEHPRADGKSGEQYEKLMLYLAEKLHSKGKLLSAAVLSGVTADGNVLYDAQAHRDSVLGCVDWINVMAYDGGDGERHSSYDFAVNSVNYWTQQRKVPNDKVILGVPFYARPSWASYEDIVKTNPNAAQWDHATYQGMDVHYNGMETIQKKTLYAKEHAGGVMIWEITQDTENQNQSLLSAVRASLSKR